MLSNDQLRLQVRQLISQSSLREAAEALAKAWAGQPGQMDRLAMALMRRLSTLEQQTARGVLSTGEADLERSRIADGLLFLADRLTDPSLEMPAHLGASLPGAGQGSGARRKMIWITGVGLLAVFAVFFIRSFGAASSGSVFDLKVYLHEKDHAGRVISEGEVRVRIAGQLLPAQELDGQGRAVFAGLSAVWLSEPVELVIPPDMRYRVVGQNVRTAGENPARSVTFTLEPVPDSTRWQGTVYDAARRPVAGATLSIDEGLTEAVTDAKGHFQAVIPKAEGAEIEVMITLDGQLLYNNTNILTGEKPAQLFLKHNLPL